MYVLPPKEAKLDEVLWKLSKTAYGLVDGPIIWYNHSKKRFLEFGLVESNYEPTLYYTPSRDLILTTQVDDFLYTGTPEMLAKFEKFC